RQLPARLLLRPPPNRLVDVWRKVGERSRRDPEGRPRRRPHRQLHKERTPLATWWNYTAHRFETKLGDSTGHGGQTIPIGHPAGKSTVPGPLVGAIAGSDLALVSNWGTGLTHYYRYVNVIPPPA